MIKIAKKYNDKKCRISGGESLVKYGQLHEVIKIVLDSSDLDFIVETNGIAIGRDETIAERMGQFDQDRLTVRVSIKHINPLKFTELTGAPPEWSKFACRSLRYLKKHSVHTIVSWMWDWYTTEELGQLFSFLIEEGYLTPWPEGMPFEEWWDMQTLIDPEVFIPYRSVKMKKSQILKMLKNLKNAD